MICSLSENNYILIEWSDTCDNRTYDNNILTVAYCGIILIICYMITSTFLQRYVADAIVVICFS